VASVKVGIVGLPNAGKSSLFAALTGVAADVANYPFTTIEPNVAVVPVVDVRLDGVARTVRASKVVPDTITFHDIAGLVAGAHRGEGLGNQFLANIRETDALVHVVRVHDDPNVVHPEGRVDPQADIETIETELIYADLEQAELAELDPEDAAAMRADLGLTQSGLERVVRGAFSLLELIAFFTAGEDKPAQSWHLRRGLSVWHAAGLIHSDIQRGFVRAEVIGWEALVDAGGYAGARERGTLRIEGRDYVMADGDVITVRFTP
jgi:ribosome-binding ATPase YchF (GTP1/OBG family)